MGNELLKAGVAIHGYHIPLGEKTQTKYPEPSNYEQ